MHPSTTRVIWFIVIGCAAALTHLGVVVALVTRLGFTPLLANVGGWLVAFCVSFTGHHSATFRAQRAPKLRSAGRFFIVSATGFTINEAAYALLLQWGGLSYEVALAIVLLAVAIATYLLSRHWAFSGIEVR